jgi:hypothetical protein
MPRDLAIMLLAVACSACQPAANQPGTTAASADDGTPRAGAPCSTEPGSPSFVDERGAPVDLTDESAAGKHVLVCAAVRREQGGRVVEQGSRRPVAGATVVVESWQTPAPVAGPSPRRRLLHTVDVVSNDEGWWRVPAAQDWVPGVLAADGMPHFVDSYCVHAEGYAPLVLDPFRQEGVGAEEQVFDFVLQRATAATPGALGGKDVSRCGIPLGPPL